MAVNEAHYTSVIAQTVGPEERQQRCEVGVVVRRRCCSAHAGNEVSSCVGGVMERSRRSCVHFGLVEAMWFLWDCLWTSSGQSTFHGEWGSLRHRVWVLSGPSLPA